MSNVDPETRDDDAEDRRERARQFVDEYMDEHRETFEKLARE